MRRICPPNGSASPASWRSSPRGCTWGGWDPASWRRTRASRTSVCGTWSCSRWRGSSSSSPGWRCGRETGEDERREESAARIEASEAALARLEELATESWMHPDALSHTCDRYRLRTRHLHGHADGVVDGPIEAKSIAQLRLARELLAVERRQLIRLRDNGAIGDAVMRRIQRELDYEELLLHHE